MTLTHFSVLPCNARVDMRFAALKLCEAQRHGEHGGNGAVFAGLGCGVSPPLRQAIRVLSSTRMADDLEKLEEMCVAQCFR